MSLVEEKLSKARKPSLMAYTSNICGNIMILALLTFLHLYPRITTFCDVIHDTLAIGETWEGKEFDVGL